MRTNIKIILSSLVLSVMISTALASADMDECGSCDTVNAQTKNNGCLAPCKVTLTYNTCVEAFHPPLGNTVVDTINGKMFYFSEPATIEVDMETTGHASGTSCDKQTITLYAQ